MTEPGPRPCPPALVGAVAALLAVDDVAEARHLATRLDRITRALPAPSRLGGRAGATLVDALAHLVTRRRLTELDPAAREEVFATLTRYAPGAQLVDALKMLALLAALGERSLARRPLTRPDPYLDCTPSAQWPTCTTADAVVVGSGAGGAMAARTLARAGMRVVMLEEGRRHTTEEFRSRPPLDRLIDLYRDGGATVALGRPPVLLPVGRGVGGTTLVNSGTCYRTPDSVLARWRDRFGLDLADRLPQLLDEVEETLNVAPQPRDVLGRNGLLALTGAQRLGWRAAPLRRNAPDCAGSCECAIGCPQGAKNGVHRTALPQACAAGARIVSEARVERLLVERGRAAGVAVRRPDGSSFEIRSPLVVVAAGATETPPLLRRSGLGRHPGLGRGLAVHPATSVAGRFAEPVVAWSGVLQSVGIEELHDRGILIEATGTPPGLGTFVLPGVGRELAEQLAAADRLALLGAMVADAPAGRVLGRRRALLRYDLSPADARTLRTAMVAMGRVMFAAGATEVLTGLARRPVARDLGELERIVAATPAAEFHLAAFHPTGSARMGADGAVCPVDTAGRLRGVQGVYVADASLLPTCPRVNPQLTIMALALGVADGIVRAA